MNTFAQVHWDTWVALVAALAGFFAWQYEKNQRIKFWKAKCYECIEEKHQTAMKMAAWRDEVKRSLEADGRFEEAKRI